MLIQRLTGIAAVALLSACASSPARLFDGMGDHTRKVSTDDATAQRYFDQGMALSYGFNHDEAVRSFEQVARIDPDCAMAYWGQAYALSPNINLEMSEANAKLAFVAIEAAIARKASASPVERDLIDALSTRFADPPPPPTERQHLDKAYADAMAVLWKTYPEDDDIGFLYADALMNLAPWNQWTADFEPTENTTTIVATLERVMELNIRHPGANHFYIHAMEASGNAQKAEAAADRLGSLIPGIGHVVHMPAHIYIQVGRYLESIECNEKASDLDRAYFAETGDQGTYHFYHAHNNHFRVWSAMYQGRYEDALESCKQTLIDLPEAMHALPDAAEWLVMESHVHVRFGRWDAVLATECPRSDQQYAVAMWHYARGIAFANTNRLAKARAEATAFEVACKEIPTEQKVWIIPAHEVLEIARTMLAGETAYHAGEFDIAFRHLRAAVVAEDALHYAEPSPWMVPTRHALGALLLERGDIAEAEACYVHDLKRHAGNGWSLHGLAECFERRNDLEGAKKVRSDFDAAWTNATVKIEASCFCRSSAK